MISRDTDDYLMLSGIQHFAFCKRQWALIHIEQQWQENSLTFSGQLLHKKTDNPHITECRGDLITSRAMPIQSHSLCVSGIADVVEFHRSTDGVVLPGQDGYWQVVPVEYKVGKKKPGDCDAVQVCAQAICLEEMFHTIIPYGYLYYGKTRRRTEIVFTEVLRKRVSDLVAEMYRLFELGSTPPAVCGSYCRSCSLVDVCLPEMIDRRRSVSEYMNRMFSEERHEKAT